MKHSASISSAATTAADIPALETVELAHVYPRGGQTALAGVDLYVRAGDIFGLLGPNGAGKTTAISIMCSLIRPTAGRVNIFGVDILKHPKRAKSLLGLVPQDIALYTELSGRENLHFFGKLYGLRGRELGKRVTECLEFVGLSDRADQKVYTYSGGMKRRANLAAGILHRPQLLFLDEPTVGIDAQSRNMILERLSHLRDQGTTMFYTTHYMEEAENLCSRVAIMDEGRVLAVGQPQVMCHERGSNNLQELFFELTGKKIRD